MKTVSLYLLALAMHAFFVTEVFAWGERGHDVVTRVAVEQLGFQSAGEELAHPFRQRAHMLAHLSNVPDIVWRADYMSEEDRRLNSPTHYIDTDLIYSDPKTIGDIARAYQGAKDIALERNLDLNSDVGTAPWRVLQFYREMENALSEAGKAVDRSEFMDAVNQALLFGGLMSHFVGDLSNPHHTTKDHDGWLTGNGGLHAYFETAVVNALPLDLAVKVSQQASQDILEQRLLLVYDQKQLMEILGDPEQLVFALALDSFQSLDRLVALDNQYSLLTRSVEADEKRGVERKSAERKSPADVANDYEGFINERMAMGATVLAKLWILAWKEAGEPELSSYQSYLYPVKPEFVPPDYSEY